MGSYISPDDFKDLGYQPTASMITLHRYIYIGTASGMLLILFKFLVL
mgnify:CR=1 FL=1